MNVPPTRPRTGFHLADRDTRLTLRTPSARPRSALARVHIKSSCPWSSNICARKLTLGTRPQTVVQSRDTEMRGVRRIARPGTAVPAHSKREGWRMGQELPAKKDIVYKPEEKGALFARVRTDIDRLIQKRKEQEDDPKNIDANKPKMKRCGGRERPQSAPLGGQFNRVVKIESAVFGGRYCLAETIGHGAYAVVRNAVHEPTGRPAALKVFDKLKSNWEGRRKLVEREIRLMDKVCRGSPNIVDFHESIDAHTHVYVVMEKLEGSLRQELNSRPLRRFGEEKARCIVAQICSAVDYLHDINVVHRDLKLENLLVDKSGEVVKLVDFGFAVKLENKEKRLKVFCGTPSYMSPEIVSGKDYSGFCADIWAIGVLIFVLLLGRFPFKAQTEPELFQRIRRGAYSIGATENHITNVSKRLVRGILRTEPSMRPTIQQVKNHQWVSTVCVAPTVESDSVASTQAPSKSTSTLGPSTQASNASFNGIGSKPWLISGTTACNEKNFSRSVTTAETPRTKLLVGAA
eukprot:GEMP01027114.1.p1 GENE.GEMP01027114.1~~GEMP01027114.1.p1  ORF type:complete len:527 (+),score=76.26 GEMP01027114.1:26-1582(+)